MLETLKQQPKLDEFQVVALDKAYSLNESPNTKFRLAFYMIALDVCGQRYASSAVEWLANKGR